MRLNLLLALVAAGLGAWLWLSTPPDTQNRQLLSTVDPESIQHIQIQRPGKPDLVLERSGNSWRITSPLQAPASQFRISSLVGLLQAPVISTVTIAPETAGIARGPDAVMLMLDDQRFNFGNINPLDRSRYVEHRGTVHLIQDTLYPQLLQAADFFVEAEAAPETASGN